MEIAALLAKDKYVINKVAHIQLNRERCDLCMTKPCIYACPAGLYQYKNQEMSFDYAGCLECGTCRVICADKTAMVWQYPSEGGGVVYRYG